jgi:hypothetical protein
MVHDHVDFRLMVEPQEVKDYKKHLPSEIIYELPEAFSERGQGSIPVRNFVWELAKSEGHERHWIFDDNIRRIRRRMAQRRIPCQTQPALAACEDFTDRYENIGIAGLNYTMFAVDRIPPYFHNVHVYSCLLIRNDLPYRWRGRYNEDTDLCLQVLSGGLCTILFNAFLIEKMATGVVKGGNQEKLYKGDGRLKMSRSLERMWPGVVKTDRRYGRPQHVVSHSWRRFDTPLIRRKDINWDDLEKAGRNEYGLRLKAKQEVRSAEVRKLLEDE